MLESTALNELSDELRRYIRRHVGDDASAEDLAQEVLLRAHVHRDDLPTPEALRHWTFRVAANVVIDHHRRRDRAPAVGGESSAVARVADGGVDDDGRGQGRALASCAKRMVETLPERYRKAVELVELAGMTQQQAAPVLGLSVSGAKSRVQRGRAELRRRLLDCCRVELDARGGVIDYEPTEKAGRYCGGENLCVHSGGPSSS